LNSAGVCGIVNASKENTGVLITLGGGAAVAKVRTKGVATSAQFDCSGDDSLGR
jgi:hypothetical protein